MPPVAYRPIRRPRPQSRSAAVRSWVLDLAPCTVFWIHEMPRALAPYASRVLHDMVREYTSIERICKGFYWRGATIAGVPFMDRLGKGGHTGIACAGAGSGYAHVSALNEIGWTTQRPNRAYISAVGRCPEAAVSGVAFTSSANSRRRDLTWAEVTLIEAVRHSDHAEPSADYQFSETRPTLGWRDAAWQEAMSALRSGWVVRCLGRGAVLRGPHVALAAETEPRPPEWFGPRIAEVVDAIGDRVEHPDASPPIRYVTEPARGNPFRVV